MAMQKQMEALMNQVSMLTSSMTQLAQNKVSHKQELEPKEQLHYVWLLKFLEANESMFAFDVP
jgi:hypothetical protein